MLGHILLVLAVVFFSYGWWETRKKNRESEENSRGLEYVYLLLVLLCTALLINRLLN